MEYKRWLASQPKDYLSLPSHIKEQGGVEIQRYLINEFRRLFALSLTYGGDDSYLKVLTEEIEWHMKELSGLVKDK